MTRIDYLMQTSGGSTCADVANLFSDCHQSLHGVTHDLPKPANWPVYEEDDEGHTVVPSYFAQFSAASFEKKGLKP